MATFWLNAGALVACSLPYDKLAEKPKTESTQVQIGIGSGVDNTGGSVPHVALWDQGGNRIGQSYGDANGHWDSGTLNEIDVEHKQNGGKKAQPEYLQVVAWEGDGICISMVSVTSNGAQWGWTGDMAKMCGGDWFPSTYMLGDGTDTPSCIWIDSDHTNGIRAQGFSLHMPDFAQRDGRKMALEDTPETNCKSGPRQTFWYDRLPDQQPDFFKPPLKYTPDGGDVDTKRVVTRKADLYPFPPRPRHKRDIMKRSANLKEGHIVISDFPAHSAKEVCEHPTSLGWDFVSTVEGIYCDITAREWWPLCSDKVKTGCFDLDKREMRGNAPGHKGSQRRDLLTGREISDKKYQTEDTWHFKPKPGH